MDYSLELFSTTIHGTALQSVRRKKSINIQQHPAETSLPTGSANQYQGELLQLNQLLRLRFRASPRTIWTADDTASYLATIIAFTVFLFAFLWLCFEIAIMMANAKTSVYISPRTVSCSSITFTVHKATRRSLLCRVVYVKNIKWLI